MKKIKISINGRKQNKHDVTDVAAHPMLELKESILVAGTERGGSKLDPLEMDINDIVELVFDDDTKWLGPPDLLEDIYPGSFTINRDGESFFELPTELENRDASRNVIDKIVLKVFNLFAKKEIAETIEVIANRLELKQMGSLRGLVRVNSNFELLKPEGLNTANPFLLFIHGTNSSTNGSFGELKGTDVWNHIVSTYGNNILAFQHETLTKSPLQNVLELTSQLPGNAILHVITHSRGGLLGEILCRFSGATGPDMGFTNQEINSLSSQDRKDDVICIKKLREIYPKKNFRVKKFIRVACPSSGTTILSKRLDHFFNISLNLLGAVPALAASPVYAAMKNLLIAIVDQKNDIKVLPGLEAMKPDSPFITVLNNQSSIVSIGDPVVAISGNCKTKLNMKALVIIASKLFFMEDNDLVVNTRSMYNGSRRKEKLQFFFDEGTDVDHFHYFRNKKTNAAILLALKFNGSGSIDGFTEHFRGTIGEAERNAALGLDGGQYSTGEPSGKKPIVILLPGIMGSSLTQQDVLVWINYLRFLTGGLNRLFIDEKNIEAPSIIKTSYKKLGDALQDEYDVVVFPFDWRISLEKSAEQFNVRIIQLLKLNQPIKIIGHSMGGVLVRDFMVYHPTTWKTLNESNGFRLLFLGSPLGGSFRINNVLFGEDDIISKISKVDIAHSKKKLLQMFAHFPGLLCLLPFNKDADNDFSRESVWTKMRTAFGDNDWPLPSDTSSDLTNFKNYRDKILNSTDIDFTNAVYIAGQDKHTPCGYRIDETSRGTELIFLSTGEGDQSVTWEMGIPKPMIAANTVYYVNYSHGALSNTPAIFNGIKEILVKGQTNLLSKNRPVLRGDQKIFKKPETSDFDFSPEGLENTILSISDEKNIISNELPIEIKVSHGDLKYASFPVLAGHFKNDSVLYAEDRINTLLQDLLKEHHKLGLYPGDIGTYEILLTHNVEGFPGAIIIGLGEPDKLTSFELTKSVEQGITRYLLNVNGREKMNTPMTVKEPLGISSLVIGCGYGGLSIENSINAILQGIINANAKIGNLYREKGKLIQRVEFIELYEDRALSCMYSIRGMSREFGGTLNITPLTNRINTLNGSRKQVNVDQGSEWWSRITITKEENKKGEVKGMRFSISTGAAREDLRTIFTCTGIEQLVESISTDNNWTDEKARAVFEYLIPNDFKNRLKKHGNIAWILDKYTAGFPWELLQDNSKDAKPLCISAGMIRQLATTDSRLNIEPVSEKEALVVGDPDLKGFITQLPGAQEESKEVVAMLLAQGYRTRDLTNRDSHEIIKPALVSSNYKIIHLAGHGAFNEDPEIPSGMVIGKNIFLTTADIAQMPTTPELVFVNCCFLGKTDGVAEEFFRSRFKLAANIGTQLIENGVKAVIVAGWAVDDAAALIFAKSFYENMFQGKTFGEAIKLSREKIYSRTKNTWGAYQCYGDPFYKLHDRKWDDKQKNYVIPAQAEIDLSNLLNDLATGETKTEIALAKLKIISAEVDHREIRTPAITELEAMIFKSMNDYKNAILKFEQLLGSENASYSMIAMEQYCNIRVKHLIERLDKEKEPGGLEKEFNKAIADLDALIQLSPSVERYNLKGSAFKRKYRLYKKIKKTKAVKIFEEAGKNYYLAYSIAPKVNVIYSFTNWIALESILCITSGYTWGKTILDYSGKSAPMEVISKVLHEMENFHLKKPVTDQYWDRILIPNIRLCEWFLAATNKKIKKIPDFKPIKESYLNVWKMAGTKDQKELEIQHLDLLIEAIKLLAPRHMFLTALVNLQADLKKAII